MNSKPCARCAKPIPSSLSALQYCSIQCRFLDIADPFAGREGCWEWPRSRNPVSGYGQLSFKHPITGKRALITAHRASVKYISGIDIEDWYVCHRCDNPGCFNPSHLFVGTMADNMRDMNEKGRHGGKGRKFPLGDLHWTRRNPGRMKRGPDNNKTKLHEAAVRDIRTSAETLVILAKRYGVSEAAVCSVRKRRSWRHVP